jgi:hypothetical protein
VSSVKIWKISSPSSPSSPDKNQAQNEIQNGEDTFDSEDTYPHQKTVNIVLKNPVVRVVRVVRIFSILRWVPTSTHAIITAVIFILMMRRITIDTQPKNTQVFLCYILPKLN